MVVLRCTQRVAATVHVSCIAQILSRSAFCHMLDYIIDYNKFVLEKTHQMTHGEVTCFFYGPENILATHVLIFDKI